jgi:hypothetical protein
VDDMAGTRSIARYKASVVRYYTKSRMGL